VHPIRSHRCSGNGENLWKYCALPSSEPAVCSAVDVRREVKELRCCSRLRSCVSWTTNATADKLCYKLQTQYSKSCPLYSCYNFN